MESSFDLGFGVLDDVMDDICFRLSASNLWQCRELVPSWRRHNRNHEIVNRQLIASKNNNVSLIFDFMWELPLMPIPYYGLYTNDDREIQLLSKFKAHPSFKKHHVAEIVGVCHGLVCMIYEDIGGIWYFGISNPSTKQIVWTVFPLDNDDAGWIVYLFIIISFCFYDICHLLFE